MNDREKYLAATVAVLVLLWGVTVGWDRYQAAKLRNESQQLDTQQRLNQARLAEARGLRAQQLLRDWQRQSLPAHLDIAKSLYQDWLRQELSESGLSVRELNESSSRGSLKHFRQATFVINAQGTLAELTEFLYRFYQSNHLHRISAASLTPTRSRQALTITLSVDALSLPGCPRSDRLAEGASDTFSAPLEELRDQVVSRNMFVPYNPETQPDQQVGSASDDQASQAFVSSMTKGAGGWQMSIRMHDSGKLRYSRQGDRIEIGQFSGEVLQLDGRRAIVAREDGQVEIQLGQNLSQARVISDQAG